MGITQILIIEDDKSTADLFNTTLSLMGYECEILTNGRLALARLAGAAPDIILLDIHLGTEITGQDILFQIRSNPRLSSTRVLVITAFPTLASSVENLADLVLMKPIDISQLKTLVQRLLTYEILPKRFQFQDPLTGVYNREFFMTRLDLAFERAKRRSNFIYSVTLIEYQIDPDKLIDSESTFSILREIANRLKNNLRPTDTIARISGARFAFLNEDLQLAEDVQIILDRLKSVLLQPYVYGAKELNLLFNISAAVSQTHYQESTDIYQIAENKLPSIYSR